MYYTYKYVKFMHMYVFISYNLLFLLIILIKQSVSQSYMFMLNIATWHKLRISLTNNRRYFLLFFLPHIGYIRSSKNIMKNFFD